MIRLKTRTNLSGLGAIEESFREAKLIRDLSSSIVSQRPHIFANGVGVYAT